MFTGIVSDVGTVIAVDKRATGVRIRMASTYDPDTIAIGASIAHAGICLTVVEAGRLDDSVSYFDVEASDETLSCTTLKDWQIGTRVNLERALALGEELGGHLVTGHVDGVAEIIGRDNDADMARLTFRVPDKLKKFVAEKGSVALDGTSLTVNGVDDATFDVMLIPHTLEITTWGWKKAGDKVNFEVDLMARYAARLAEAG
ncbi:riboflavin synthase [Rhodobium orientis]|uniref:Riboflavin synthase n=1 Tax=Rhodobium orientis TaxID=34017 RepID=A0A327JPD5_9HYPH|nr:riboflavin synthase [Rhodobium orientis]MBB4304816.1 riboflavin synthase [Rhodobium orientis]MBK5948010.1 riboflavin synthase [Rhodobium orientis]RAI27446.1 riboflavin synthase [Rhodobium orientis]